MADSQTKQPAGYRLVKSCSLVFWSSTDTRGKRRQSHLYEWDADAFLQAHLSHLHCKKKPLKQAYVRFVDEKENLMGIDWFNPDLLSSGRRLTR